MINHIELLKGEWEVKGHIVFVGDTPVGILLPNTSYYLDDEENSCSFVSKNGLLKSENLINKDLWTSLIESGAVLFGENEDEIIATSKLFKENATSRTFSYLSLMAKDCAELLMFFDEIKSASILILGCGGIGSMTAISLCGSGVKNITLADFDTIEKSNLNRQFFYDKADVGKLKIDVLEKAIHARFDDVIVNKIAKKIEIDNFVDIAEKYSLVISTLDEPAYISQELSILSNEKKMNVLFAGYMNQYSAVYLNKPINDNELVKLERGSNFIAPSYGPVNMELAGIVSSTAIQAIIKGNKESTASIFFESTSLERKYK